MSERTWALRGWCPRCLKHQHYVGTPFIAKNGARFLRGTCPICECSMNTPVAKEMIPLIFPTEEE